MKRDEEDFVLSITLFLVLSLVTLEQLCNDCVCVCPDFLNNRQLISSVSLG